MRPTVALVSCVTAASAARPMKASWPLFPVPASVPRARRLIGVQLVDWGIGGQGEVIRLLTSELVTNALHHAWGPIRLTVFYRDGTLRCEVEDANPDLPRVRNAHKNDEGGRGLYLLDLLSDRWGSDRTPAGKVSWFELPAHTHPDGTAAA